MAAPAITQTEVTVPIEVQQNDHRFFDPRSPEQPQEIVGVETQAILRLGRAVTALGVLPPGVNLGLYALPDAVRLFPLIQEMQSGVPLTPEDVRPYRKPIKGLSLELGFADKAAAAAGLLAVGVPARRALNRKIEGEFPARASEAIAKAREAVADIEHEVDFVAGFENPKEQFLSEVNALAQTVSDAIVEQRDRRVRNGLQPETAPETPKGIAGLVVQVARKIRSFFGFFRRHKTAVNNEVTAYDAGAGIEQALTVVTQNSDSEGSFPLLSRYVLSRLPNELPVTKDKLALVAPEILNFLFSAASDQDKGQDLLDSVNRNPHELRFVTRFKKRYGRFSLEGIQRASLTLMPAIRDILPSEGTQVHRIFGQVQNLLQYSPPEMAKVEPEIKRSWWKRQSKKD